MIKNESRLRGAKAFAIFAQVRASYIFLFSANVTPTFTVMEREASGNCLGERNECRVFERKFKLQGEEKKKGEGEGEEKTGSIAQVEQIKLAVKNNLQT